MIRKWIRQLTCWHRFDVVAWDDHRVVYMCRPCKSRRRKRKGRSPRYSHAQLLTYSWLMACVIVLVLLVYHSHTGA